MFNELKKIPVFFSRDIRILFTYKLAFSSAFLGVIFTLFHLVLFGSMFGATAIPALIPYGGDYISYILIGSIGWGFLWSIVSVTTEGFSEEMVTGTLESVILTSTKMYTMVFSYALFGCFFGLVMIVLLIVVGALLFGTVVFQNATMFTFIIFVLSSTMMVGLSLIFGGLTIWLKKIGETIPLLQNIAMFFCGVYFPITVLPAYLQPISKILPFYYSIEGLRRSLIPSTPTSELIYYIVVLLGLSILFFIVGNIVLYKGLMKAKKDGTLAFY